MLGFLLTFGWPGIAALVFGSMFLWKTIKGSRKACGIAALACIGLAAASFWPTPGTSLPEEKAAGSQAKKTQIYGNLKKKRQAALLRRRVATSTAPANVRPGLASVAATPRAAGIGQPMGIPVASLPAPHLQSGPVTGRPVSSGGKPASAPAARAASVLGTAPFRHRPERSPRVCSAAIRRR